MAVLQSTNVQGALCVNGVAVGGGKDFKFCCFSGSGNWTPSQDLVDGGGSIETILVAGGGGSGAARAFFCRLSAAGGGGGGEVTHKFNTITATSNCCYSIGAGGGGGQCVQDKGGANFIASQKGGNTTFVGVTAYGGGGGASYYNAGSGGGYSDTSNIVGGPMGGNVHGSHGTCAPNYGHLGCTYGGASSIQPHMGSTSAVRCGSVPATCVRSCVVSGSGDSNSARSLTGTFTLQGMAGMGYGAENWGAGGGSAGGTGMYGGFCNPNDCGDAVVTASVFGAGGAAGYSLVTSTGAGPGVCGTHGGQGLVVLKWAE